MSVIDYSERFACYSAFLGIYSLILIVDLIFLYKKGWESIKSEMLMQGTFLFAILVKIGALVFIIIIIKKGLNPNRFLILSDGFPFYFTCICFLNIFISWISTFQTFAKKSDESIYNATKKFSIAFHIITVATCIVLLVLVIYFEENGQKTGEFGLHISEAVIAIIRNVVLIGLFSFFFEKIEHFNGKLFSFIYFS